MCLYHITLSPALKTKIYTSQLFMAIILFTIAPILFKVLSKRIYESIHKSLRKSIHRLSERNRKERWLTNLPISHPLLDWYSHLELVHSYHEKRVGCMEDLATIYKVIYKIIIIYMYYLNKSYNSLNILCKKNHI